MTQTPKAWLLCRKSDGFIRGFSRTEVIEQDWLDSAEADGDEWVPVYIAVDRAVDTMDRPSGLPEEIASMQDGDYFRLPFYGYPTDRYIFHSWCPGGCRATFIHTQEIWIVTTDDLMTAELVGKEIK